MNELQMIAVAIGNTRTRIGRFEGKDLQHSESLKNTDIAAIRQAVTTAAEGIHDAVVVVASVNPSVAIPVLSELESVGDLQVLRIGVDVPIPLTHALDDASTLGQDRALNAIAAFKRSEQACVVIDVGTAVTVDFVDGTGVFQGGVIAPGLVMMLDALHARTAALPSLSFEAPDPARGVFGLDTRHAMLLGVMASVQGLVHLMIGRYAEKFGAYPQIIATGGDAPLLFENDELVEHVVPDLQLMGIREAYLASISDEEESGPGWQLPGGGRLEIEDEDNP